MPNAAPRLKYGEKTADPEIKSQGLLEVSIPRKFANVLTDAIVINRGLDGCLWLYSSRDWIKRVKILKEIPERENSSRHLVRFTKLLISGASTAQLNKGKITIPNYLRDFAKIRKAVVFIGINDLVELWAAEEYEKYKKKTDETVKEELIVYPGLFLKFPYMKEELGIYKNIVNRLLSDPPHLLPKAVEFTIKSSENDNYLIFTFYGSKLFFNKTARQAGCRKGEWAKRYVIQEMGEGVDEHIWKVRSGEFQVGKPSLSGRTLDACVAQYREAANGAFTEKEQWQVLECDI